MVHHWAVHVGIWLADWACSMEIFESPVATMSSNSSGLTVLLVSRMMMCMLFAKPDSGSRADVSSSCRAGQRP